MERSRTIRYLRIAVTALSLTACVLLIALWVRSYWWWDRIYRVSAASRLQSIGSNRGTVRFESSHFRFRPHTWRYFSNPDYEMYESFRWHFINGNGYIQVPHWLIVLIGAGAATVPWIHRLRRFSLRTLLIAMTLIAVGLGIIVWSG